jgi:hypothetical protein
VPKHAFAWMMRWYKHVRANYALDEILYMKLLIEKKTRPLVKKLKFKIMYVARAWYYVYGHMIVICATESEASKHLNLKHIIGAGAKRYSTHAQTAGQSVCNATVIKRRKIRIFVHMHVILYGRLLHVLLSCTSRVQDFETLRFSRFHDMAWLPSFRAEKILKIHWNAFT